MRNTMRLLVCGAVASVLSGPAMADIQWTVTGTPTNGLTTVKAYANTGNVTVSTKSSTNATMNHANNGAIQTIQAATLKQYSGGVGVSNADKCSSGSTCDVNEGNDPEHAIDNQQRYDMVLLTFAAPVELTKIKLGWWSTDSDVTVLAYKGAGNPSTDPAANKSLVGLTYSQLITNSWKAIGNYGDVGTTAKSINSGHVSSSYWLIGAYNPLALNAAANPCGALDKCAYKYDYVKLASVMGFYAAPEPGSAALIGAALIGLIAIRRRKRA